MCGIAGIVHDKISKEDVALLKTSLSKIAHRGPDNTSLYAYETVALGHVRLSILDLSENGNQPMFANNGELAIVFNGEIYNYLDLKQLLPEFHFKSNSDTEIILYGYLKYGAPFIEKLNGIFAIAIWDNASNELLLARDRMGVKPLYYYFNKEKKTFVFGSEIKSILPFYPKNNINYSALSQWTYYGNSTGNLTLYQDIHKVDPATILYVKNNNINVRKYWDLENVQEIEPSENEAKENVINLLQNAVKRQLISDVPVGIFLSGGIDSGSIAAFASQYADKRLDAFTADFDFSFDKSEITRAKNLAQKFNLNHHIIGIDSKNLTQVVEKLIWHHDEPFADAANIPLYLLAEQLRGKIKVILQGDGGDELFGGYLRYNTLSRFSNNPILQTSAIIAGFLINSIPQIEKLNRYKRYLNIYAQKKDAMKMALLLTVETLYNNPNKIFNPEIQNKLDLENPFIDYINWEKKLKNKDLVQRMLYIDTQIILPNTFNEKVDKSTMAQSIEVRVPFLDNELVNYALSLKSSIKIKDNQQKYILKKALENTLPHDVLYGKKLGFGVPYHKWIIGELKPMFLDLLKNQKVEIINKKTVTQMLAEYEKNQNIEKAFLLWKAYNFLIWNKSNSVQF